MFKRENQYADLKNLVKWFFVLLPAITNAQEIETLLVADFKNTCGNVDEGEYSKYFKGYHTGNDYFCRDLNAEVKAISFGKISFRNDMPITDECKEIKCTKKHDHGMGNVLEITHLLTTGEEVTSSYNHLAKFHDLSEINRYVVGSQIIAYVGGSGQESATYWKPPHLHFEMKTEPRDVSMSGPWGYSGKANFPNIPADYGFLSPNDYIDKANITLPILSRTDKPDKITNFDVYGIANKPIYGFLDLTGDFQESSIVVRDFFIRAKAEEIGNLDNKHRFLGGKHENKSVTGIVSPKVSYNAGDYLFLGYVKNDDKQKFGYPVKFSFVNEGGVIVDNDQRNADDDKNNDAGNEPTYNGTIADAGSKVPGYFLTADLHSGRSDAFAQWKPYKKGDYKIYVHIPEYGATATNVRYAVKKDGTDSNPPILSRPISHSKNANLDTWVQLVSSDGNDIFQFDENGYVELLLNNDEFSENYDINKDQKVAFDAIKFESTWTTLSKNWAGTWNWSGQNSGDCHVDDGGDMTMTLEQSGKKFSGSVVVAGLQRTESNWLYGYECKIISTDTHSGRISGVIEGKKVSFNMNIINKLFFKGEGTIESGMFSGSLVRLRVRPTGGSGSFSLQ